MKATAKELRFQSKKLLETVAMGEDVVITFRGKPCAKLVPYVEGETPVDRSEEDELFGIWQDRDDIINVDEHVRNLRKGRGF